MPGGPEDGQGRLDHRWAGGQGGGPASYLLALAYSTFMQTPAGSGGPHTSSMLGTPSSQAWGPTVNRVFNRELHPGPGEHDLKDCLAVQLNGSTLPRCDALGSPANLTRRCLLWPPRLGVPLGDWQTCPWLPRLPPTGGPAHQEGDQFPQVRRKYRRGCVGEEMRDRKAPG